MRRMISLAVVAALAALPALAQPPKQPFGGFGRGGSMMTGIYLANKSVQTDLKLTEEQVKKITELGAKQKKAREDLQNADPAERFKKIMEMAQAEEKAYTELLKPEQTKRLKQITLQAQGLNGLAFNPDLAKDLAITDDQKTKMQEIQAETFKQTVGLRDAASTREEMQKKAAEITKTSNEKLQALLTAEQKTKWKEMTGEPFKGDLPTGFGFGGRRPPE